MAGFGYNVTVNFDSNIEKVLYGSTSSIDENSNAVTTSGGYAYFAVSQGYFKPIFKDGYEIDTYTNVETTPVDGVYFWSNSYGFTVTFTSKLSSGGGTMSKTYDMSTSDKWASLADGEHTVQIVAKGSGYKDSEKSAGVTVSKGEGVTDSLFVSDFDTRTQLSVVEQTAAGDETWAGIIYDNYGNIVLLAPRGVLTFVSYKVSSTAYTDVKTRLTNAYTTIDNATSLFELNSEIEDYIRSLNPDLTADDFKVAYLDDISLSDDYNDCLLQGNVMTVVLNMDTSKNYIVMYSEDGQSNWGLLDSAQVEVTSDGILLYLDTAPLVLAILEQQ